MPANSERRQSLIRQGSVSRGILGQTFELTTHSDPCLPQVPVMVHPRAVQTKGKGRGRGRRGRGVGGGRGRSSNVNPPSDRPDRVSPASEPPPIPNPEPQADEAYARPT
eukprot:3845375-Pyramimonas_sp.AAC.1